MGLTLARIVVSVVLFCAPIFAFVVLSRKPGNAMFLLFPVFGAIPAIVAALLLFVPIEIFLEARGMALLRNIAIPLAGALVVFIFMIVMGILWGDLGRIISRLASGGWSAWAGIIVWSVLGAVWGLVWRATEWIAKWMGLVNG